MMSLSKSIRRALSFLFVGLLSCLLILMMAGKDIPGSMSFAAEEESPSWSYGGADNPTQWGQLSQDFSTCELGRDQSPIDLEDDNAVKGESARIKFNYVPAPLDIVNNGHTIQANYGEGSTANIAGEDYKLLQMHFHTPSEHTLNQKASAMELHLVHANASGQLAVVGVMMDEGEKNPSLDSIWSNIPSEKGSDTPGGQTINAIDFLPKDRAYYSYRGSLTTPPCSEEVSWNVMTQSIPVSEEQIAAFATLYQVNARPVQPSNGRVIKLHESSSQ